MINDCIKYLNLHHLSSNIINIKRRIPDAICVFLVGQMNSPSIVVRGDRSSAAWVGWQGHVIIVRQLSGLSDII